MYEIGDVNGDSYPDFLVGSPMATSGNGIAYLVWGKSTLSSLSTLSLTSLGSNGIYFTGQTDSRAGRSLSAVGDINRDGYADFLIGAWNYNSGQGRSYLIYGNSTKYFSTSTALGTLGSKGIIITGAAAGDQAGMVSNAGDVNGDLYPDFLIGAAYAGSNVGKVYIIFGGTNLPATISLASLGSYGIAITGAAANCYVGGILFFSNPPKKILNSIFF